jgi:hypothetical protein
MDHNMPTKSKSRRVNVLRVFVASPDDVRKERERLKLIIDEVNKEIGSESGVQLELVKYETDVTPGMASDPQDVIDKQINDDYDIFIGILWKKFGTPTKNASSGTEAEFNRAYERNTTSPGIVDIMIYFKESPIDRNEIDPKQIELIDGFRKNLGGKGILWTTFKTMRQFEEGIRRHLHSVVRTFKESRKPKREIKTKEKDRDTLGNFSGWKLLYEHDENGVPLTGNVEHLIDTVSKGSPIRIRVHHPNKTFQVMDAPLLSVENGIVYASDIDQISKTRDASGNYIYQEKTYHYLVIASSNGHFHAKRIFLDGTERNITNSKRHIAWFGIGTS